MNTIKIYFSMAFGLFFLNSNAQIFTISADVPAINGSNVIIDGSTAYSVEAGSGPNVGKGIIIPSVDLVNFEFDLTYADGSTFPTFFDGMIVYNNASGTTLTAGNRSSTATAITPGFYYYSNVGGFNEYDAVSGNPQIATALGVWTPMGGGGGSSSAVAIADGVASGSYATINATQEKVVRLTGIAAGGVKTTLDLDAALTSASVTIAKFRKAAIYNAAGDLVMHATGGYTTGTDILVTGNGMMNKLLPVGNYSVEVYYTE
jgi:hypothetical protein